MIRSLHIKDFALIDELDVEFGPGLNILTGQTGAGKSIIVGALNMILGERADTDVIRQGSDKAVAEAIMEVETGAGIRELLEENEVEAGGELILRREIRRTGSRAFINDTPVTITLLRQVGDHLVDLHGQHEHQSLLRDENHRRVIDEIDAVRPFLNAYRESREALAAKRGELQRLRRAESELRQKSELYRFQVRELEEARLDPDEEKEMLAEMKRLDNAEELDSKAALIEQIGSDEETGLLRLLHLLREQIDGLAAMEPEFDSYREEVRAAGISLREAVQFAERYRSRIEFNPERLEELRRRQALLNRLRKKYNRDIPELVAYLGEIRAELDLSENFDLEIEKLESEIERLSGVLRERAVELHRIRIETGKRLAGEIRKKLLHLGIPHPLFDVRVDWLESDEGWIEAEGRRVDCTPDGADEVRFFISTNRGEEPRPLARIASGGEVSRVMLALKSVIASRQRLPVMIFDEIDTGISGQVSEKVGRAMRLLAEQCQIIAITHQPQIASQAHRHYRVEKLERDERTVTRILALDEREHVEEVAGLMSGEEVTESARNNARELIEKNRT